MNDAVAVALKGGAQITARFLMQTAPAFMRNARKRRDGALGKAWVDRHRQRSAFLSAAKLLTALRQRND
jgi:hypothetical protein